MDRLHHMRVLVAVVKTNGLAGAARKLNLSPSVVTRAINELERQLAVRLLARSTCIVRVTDAGARYADDCRRILAEIAEVDEPVSGTHRAPRGRLLFGAPRRTGRLLAASRAGWTRAPGHLRGPGVSSPVYLFPTRSEKKT